MSFSFSFNGVKFSFHISTHTHTLRTTLRHTKILNESAQRRNAFLKLKTQSEADGCLTVFLQSSKRHRNTREDSSGTTPQTALTHFFSLFVLFVTSFRLFMTAPLIAWSEVT